MKIIRKQNERCIIRLSASSLEENGIEKIEQAELKFKITNPDNYKEHYESHVVSFNVG